MGLDGVELLMAVEERFGIEITDQEAQDILTTRMMYECVGRKIRSVPSDVCLTQRAFYLLRRLFRSDFSIPRSAFRLDVSLEQLIPLRDRKLQWDRLKEQLGAKVWPELKLRRAIAGLITAGALGLGALTLFWAGSDRPLFSLILALLTTAFSAYLLVKMARPLRTSLAGHTVGTLSEFIVSSNAFLVAPPSNEWTPERIRLEVRQIVIDQLAVPPDFSDDAEFVKDLGLD
jgi:acyl carrier protein